MKRLILFLALSFSFLLAKTQTWDPVKGHYEFQFTKNDSSSAVPFDTLKSAPVNSIAIKNGVMYMKAATTHWVSVTGGTSGATWGVNIGGTITTQGDLMALLGLKVNFSDTAHMLLNYQRSATAMKYADTAAMLAPYLRSALFNKTNLGLGNVLNSAQVINSGGATSIQVGTFASIPSVISGPTWWFASDTVAWYYNNGSAYVKASGSGGGGGGGDDSTLMASKHFVALNYYPLTGNPSAFLTSISSGQVITALGFTPYSNSNPSGFISANQVISFTPSGDVSTTGGSGSTSLTPAFTVTGLEGHALASLSNGNLHYNTSGGWTFDNTTYLPFADAPIITRLGFRGDTLVRQNGFNFTELGLVDSSLGGIHHRVNADGTVTLYGDSVKFYAQYPLIAINDSTFGIDTLATLGGGFNAIALQGFLFTASPTTSGQVPTYNGTSIIWTTPSGGGGGGLTSLTSPNSTINIGGTLTAPTLDFNPASNIAATGNWTWSAAPTPSVASTINFGSGSLPWLTGFFNSIAAPANFALGVGSGHEIDLNVGSATKFAVLSTGQQSWFAYNANAFPGSTASDTVVVENGGKVKTIPITSFGLTGNPLSQFASTASAQLAGVISDETGSGKLVFGTSPQLINPILNTTSTTNYVWTASDGTGDGSWQPVSGGGGLSAVFGVGQLTVANGDTVELGDTSLNRKGTVLSGAGGFNIAEPSVIRDINSTLLGRPSTDTVFKDYYTEVNSSGYPHVAYAESYNGLPGTFTIKSSGGDSVISGHWRGSVYHNITSAFGTLGYYYWGANVPETQIDEFYSTTGAPGSWSLLHSAVITAASLGVTNIYNSWVAVDPATNTWYMLLDVGLPTSYGFADYLFSSTDGAGAVWTANSTNPVLPKCSGPWFTKLGSTWYAFGHSTMDGADITPTDGFWWSSTDLVHWTFLGEAFPRLTKDEGVSTLVGQVGDLCLVPTLNNVYLFYTAAANGNSTGGAVQNVAVFNGTLSNLVTTSINIPLRSNWQNNGDGSIVYNQGNVSIGRLSSLKMPFTVAENDGTLINSHPGAAAIETENFFGGANLFSAVNYDFNLFHNNAEGWQLLDSTQKGYDLQISTNGLIFFAANTGSRLLGAPINLGSISLTSSKAVFNVGTVAALGRILMNGNVDDGTGNGIQALSGLSFTNATMTSQLNGLFINDHSGTVVNTSVVIGSTKNFAGGYTGTDNVFINSQNNTGTTATQDVFIGFNSGGVLTSGAFDEGVGEGNMSAVTTGGSNASFGRNGFGSLTTGGFMTGIGNEHGRSYTTAQYGSVFGYGAGWVDTWQSSFINSDSFVVIGDFAQNQCNGCGILGDVSTNGLHWGINTYAPRSFFDLEQGMGIKGSASIRFKDLVVTTTALAGNGATMTYTFATQVYPPFRPGQLVDVTGAAPSGYNVSAATVVSCTTTSLTISGTATGSQTSAAVILADGKPASGDSSSLGVRRDTLWFRDMDNNLYALNFPTIAAGIGGIYGGNGTIPSGGSTVTGTGLLTLSPNFLILSPGTSTLISTGLALSGWHNVTSGTSDAFPNAFTNTLINPASVLTTFTETLPNSPEDGQLVKIFFGGTIATGSPVVTALTISAPGGATIIGTAPTTATSGTCFIYQYNASSSVWYRQQ